MNWINIKKKKPPLDTPVLVYQLYPYGTQMKIAEYITVPSKKRPLFGVYIEREKDGTVYGGFPLDHVTHWMPLPNPPVKQGLENP